MQKRSHIKILSLFLIAICGSFLINATPKEIRFRTIQTETSFPSKSTRTIIQDSTGFLWFGTYESLIRFNGFEYKLFENDKADSSSLGSYTVSALFIDRHKQLWTGGRGGLSRYIPECECFEQLNKNNLLDNTIYAIQSDSEETLWLGTDSGVVMYDYLNNQTSLQFTQKKVPVLKIVRNTVFMGTESDGLYIGDLRSKKIIKTINDKNFHNFDSQGKAIADLDFDENGNIWFSTSNGGAYKYNLQNDSLLKLPINKNSKALKETVFCVRYINSQNILWGTQNHGILHYNDETGAFSHVCNHAKAEAGHESNTVRTIYPDIDNNFWIGTDLTGVYYFNLYDLTLEHYYSTSSELSNGPSGIVSNFAEDKKGNLWIATDGEYIFKFNEEQNSFTQLTAKDSIPSKNITDIAFDKKNNLWISPWHNALIRLQPESGKTAEMFYKETERNTRRSWNDFKGLFNDSQNRTWAFPAFKSPLIFHGDTLFSVENNGPYPKELFELPLMIDAAEDSLGGIWLYGFESIAYLNKDFKLKQYAYDKNDQSSLISNSVMNIFIDSENNVWISAFNGLELFDYDSESFTHVSEKYGLPKEIYAMLEDDKGYLWFTSPLGLGRFHPDNMHVHFFEKNIELEGSDFISRAAFKSKKGYMYFGSTKGFIKFHPDKLKSNKTAPNTLITDFLLYNKKIDFTDSVNLLTKPIYISDSLIVAHTQNMLGFKFAALDFVAPHKNEFAYMLEGFDDEWNQVGRQNSATYTNLDPGEYLLKVKSRNNEGIWSTGIRTLVVIVTPPWWKTWWFRLTALIFILTTVFLTFYLRMLQIKRANIRLEEMVQIRTAELKAANNQLILKNAEIEDQKNEIENQNKALIEKSEEIVSQQEELKLKNASLEELNKTKDKFFSIIAHDLKNPLNAVLGLADLLSGSFNKLSDDKKIKFVHTIANSSKLLFNLIENLLNWARSQSGKLPFRPVKTNISFLIKQNVNTLQQHAANKGIQLTYSSDDVTVIADFNMIDTIIRNLLSNAIKFTPKGGSVKIAATEIRGEAVQIAFHDTGVGMDEETLSNLFKIDVSNSRNGTENETGTGLGLILCKEFVEQHSGKIWAESEVDKGTSFFVQIPLEQIHPGKQTLHS